MVKVRSTLKGRGPLSAGKERAMERWQRERLGEFIAKRRKELGLSRAELAAMVGVTEMAIGTWETGQVLQPRQENLVNLAFALQWPVGDLLRRAGYPEEAVFYGDLAKPDPVEAYYRAHRKVLGTGKARDAILAVMHALVELAEGEEAK